MFDPWQFKTLVVQPTLKDLAAVAPGSDHPAAVNLLVGTCWQESRGGTYLKQLGDGPALGVYQIEPATYYDLWDNYIDYRENLRTYVDSTVARRSMASQLIWDLRYATIIARLLYYRQNFEWPAPNNVRALGEIWKRFYNTEHGAGTVDEFVHNFPTSVL